MVFITIYLYITSINNIYTLNNQYKQSSLQWLPDGNIHDRQTGLYMVTNKDEHHDPVKLCY